MNKITIIIPSYNHKEFLHDRLSSIQEQTYKSWELVIIDDCSTDGSTEVLQKFVNSNIEKVTHYIVNKKNSGSGYKSWEKGIELAKTKYIWIAETDDYSEPTFLEETLRILETDENISVTFCSSNYVDKNKKFLYNTERRTQDLCVSDGGFKTFDSFAFLDKMPTNTYITNGSSVVFRKPEKKIPTEIFSFKQSSDQFLWTYLIKNKSFSFLNKSLNYFRRHENSTTTKMNVLSNKKIYEENIKYLNYFNQKDKFQMLLNHYIKHYLWDNKKDLFNYGFLKEINNIKYLNTKYYLSLTKFIFNKFKNGKMPI